VTSALAPLHGGCHCGHLSIDLSLTQAPSALQPRACDCAFCTKHGAAWISDPAGELLITSKKRGALGEYRQGSGSARFLHCRECGILVAVVHEADGGLRGAANVRCLDDAALFGEAVTVSPQKLSKDDKLARWGTLWTPARLHVAA
jgi:hypothetical protein